MTLSIVLGLDMYWHLILAFVLLALPVYLIVVKYSLAADPADNNNPSVIGAGLWLFVVSGCVSGASFALVLVCYQGYSHLWLAVLPLLSGGSVFSLFRRYNPDVQTKVSLIALPLGLFAGLFYSVAIVGITLSMGWAPFDYYVGVLSDDDSHVPWRSMAAKGLGKLGDERGVDPLIETLSDDDRDVREAAAKALEQLGDKRAVDPLIKTLSDDDWRVRKAAAEALGKLGDKRAVDPLIEALSDDDIWVRNTATEALVQLGDPAVDPLIKTLSDDESDVRRSAAEALGRLGDERAVEPLIKTLSDDGLGVSHAAAKALAQLSATVDPLIKALSDGGSNVRQSAAWALGQLGDKRAVDPLIKALSDDDSGVRSAAEEALKKLGYEE